MTTPTALIAEDEALLAADLQAALTQLWPALRIAGLAHDGMDAVRQALALQPDVLFLDIRMPGQSGLEAAQALVEDWPQEGAKPFPLIVFVTAHDEYALQAFEQAAIDYVLKPVQRARLEQTCARLQAALKQRLASTEDSRAGTAPSMDEVMQQLRSLIGQTAPARASPLRVIQAGTGQAIHMVPIDEVLYFEAADKYVRIVTREREHLIRTSLRELQPQLDAQRFWQIHRGTIVRCDAIASAVREDTGKLRLSLRGHPDKLTVSRLYAHLFRPM